MMDRSHAPAFSRPWLVLSLLVALFAFVMLHDSAYQHANESAGPVHKVSENLDAHHSLALCALLTVGASITIALRKIRATPRRSSAARPNVPARLAVGDPSSSPDGSRSRFDFSPILA